MLGHVVSLSLPAEGQPTARDGHASLAELRTSRGRPRPFGASADADGVNFAVFSRHAHAVTLVLFEDGHDGPIAEVPLDPARHRTGDVWHVHVHGLRPGALYGYRVNGPFAPRQGHRFNPRVVLLDPYAKAISGPHPWGSRTDWRHRPMRLSRVVADDFDWEGDVPPAVPLERTVLYELHVRGYTRHPSSGVAHPGTFLGLCDKIAHLTALGVTAVQLMPALEFDEHAGPRHPKTGEALFNYWGYSPLSFLAPKEAYATAPGRQCHELKEMVKRFHAAGIEVILDVVFNHTGEGNEHGPGYGPRKLDNAIYYMLDREGRYYNYTGCGNTVNCNHPVVRQLIIDALVELVAEYHIDGFRFDLAAILARGEGGAPLADPPLVREIAEHPVLAGAKLIAEVWDAAGLNLQGKFATWGRWAELNGPFRDDVRRFVRSDAGAAAGLAKRLAGSLDMYPTRGTSVNFITCHDGFTLHDLVSYNHKHNEANGEGNRDGWDWNFSFNCGVEGPTESGAVQALRERQKRNFLVHLFVAQGVPLLLMGDEMGRTQLGNNNAYCQDNDIGWVDWGLAEKNAGLLRFVRLLIALRRKYFALGREAFVARASWHDVEGDEADWAEEGHTLALRLAAAPGQPGWYLLFNAHWTAKRFALPRADGGGRWRRLIDTSLPAPDDVLEEPSAVPVAGEWYEVPARATVVLMC